MSRSTAVVRLALAAVAATVATPLAPALAAQDPAVMADSRVQDDALFTTQELDNLLAPVALYPDPILAELFVAATYPEQVQLAHRYVTTYGPDGIDDQAWDLSVKAIARYEPVLNMLAERPNWATAVGRAYAMQPGDVMASVQSLRQMARAQGNLVSTEQQRVEVEREYIRIVPAQPRVVYVPVYDPYVVYYRPVNYVHVATPYWSFGIGYPIGAWLAYDLDWHTRVVYYHGWNGYGRRHTWYHVSRPYVVYNAIYMGPRVTVVINTGIRHRHVNYGGFGYYNTVHRTTRWDRRGIPGGGWAPRTAKAPQPDRYGVPGRGSSGTYRPGKSDEGTVPRVGRAPVGGGSSSARPPRAGGDDRPGRGDGSAGARPPRSGDGLDRGRGNGNGRAVAPSASVARAPVAGDRVKPVREGGSSRPLYPRGEDISADRARGTVPRGNAGNGPDNGTWNARRAPEASAPRAERSSAGGYVVPNTRGRDADPVRAPRATAERVSPSTPSRYERSAPRTQGRYDAPRSAPQSAPRASQPRYESPRYETPRSAPRSAPRASQPRYEAPRSAPRASAPSAPRASAPRSSGSSAPRMSAPRGGGSSAPRAAKGSKGGRG